MKAAWSLCVFPSGLEPKDVSTRQKRSIVSPTLASGSVSGPLYTLKCEFLFMVVKANDIHHFRN